MKIREITLCAIFTAAMAVLSLISVPLPTGIPVTLSVLGVFFCGMLLSPKCAVITELVYIALGAVGVPIFSGFRGGLAALTGPTGGYIMAYPFMVLVLALGAKVADKRSSEAKSAKVRFFFGVPFYALCSLLSMFVLYVLGTAWLSISSGLPVWEALAAAVIPFILPDLMKMGVALLVVLPIRSRLKKLIALQ